MGQLKVKQLVTPQEKALYTHYLIKDLKALDKMLKNNNLLNDKKWPGLGRMRVQANITDEEAIKKFMDGRYFTFSAGSTTDRHVCSICENDWIKDGMCEHRHGKEYDGETCVFITGDFIVMEGSVVNTPADDLSQIIHMELTDKEGSSEITDYLRNVEQITLTDSIYDIGVQNETRIQETKQVDAYEEKGSKEEEESSKEKVEKKYDHEMSISESAMMELHEKGETYITQRGDNETMVIKSDHNISGMSITNRYTTNYLYDSLVNIKSTDIGIFINNNSWIRFYFEFLECHRGQNSHRRQSRPTTVGLTGLKRVHLISNQSPITMLRGSIHLEALVNLVYFVGCCNL